MTASRLRLLAIDDDTELTALMREYFAKHGFEFDSASDGSAGLVRALEREYDVIVLDVMLPTLDGFEVLRQIRRTLATPIIMLTARTERPDRILGLDAGADDYLPKPFGPDELLARIRAILRRTGRPAHPPHSPMTAGTLTLDPAARKVTCDGAQVDVTATEFDALELLVRAAGRTVSRDALSAVIHQRPANTFERSLDVHISRLRKKLDETGVSIKSVRNVGYQLIIERRR